MWFIDSNAALNKMDGQDGLKNISSRSNEHHPFSRPIIFISEVAPKRSAENVVSLADKPRTNKLLVTRDLTAYCGSLEVCPQAEELLATPAYGERAVSLIYRGNGNEIFFVVQSWVNQAAKEHSTSTLN